MLAGALAFSGVLRLNGAGGQVWHVPGDFPTIQAAVDAAAEGDTILVSPGVYTEHVVVSTSHLTLRGAGPVSPAEKPSESASDGIRVGGLPRSINNSVHHNRIVDNGRQSTGRGASGIQLTGPSNDNQVLYNEILGTNGRGVFIARPSNEVPISGILVAHNRLHGNQRAGIALMGAATGNIVVHNDARDNNLSGLGPCRRCNPFDASIGRNGGNIWDNNLGIFASPGDPCAVP